MNTDNNYPTIEIPMNVFGNDYDEADKVIVNREIEEANRGDNDEEEAIKYGY